MSYTDEFDKTSTKLVHQMLTIQSCQNAVAPICKERQDERFQESSDITSSSSSSSEQLLFSGINIYANKEAGWEAG